MFRLLSIFLLTILHTHTYAQNVVVSATQMNVLYIGIDNPIEVAAEGIKNNELVVSINNGGSVTPTKDGSYIVRVTTPGPTLISVVRKKKNGSEQLLREIAFRAKRLPDLKVYLANNKGNIIQRNYLPYAKGLTLNYEGFDFDPNFKLKSFTFSTCREGKIYMAENKGAKFSPETQSLINEAQSGDVLFFENMIVQFPDGVTRKLAWHMYHVDGIVIRRCDSNEVALPVYPTLFKGEDSLDNYTHYRYALNCSCDCIDEAKGNYIDGYKDGWWEYNKITDKETTTVRKEFYNKDTITQQFYEEGILVKRVNLIGKRQYGTYDEYYPNGIQKIHGQYVIDTVAADTIMQINPITLEEQMVVEYRTDSVRNGEWFFYDTKGILVRKEVYEPKKNRCVID